MKYSIFSVGSLCAVLFFLISCGKTDKIDTSYISTDSATIVLGQKKFSENCAACHNFRQDGIGPQLGGLTGKVAGDWLKEFIKNPKAKIEAGDTRSVELFNMYKTQMPSYSFLTDDDITAILSFIHTKDAPDAKKAYIDPNALADAIPEKIPMSDIVVELKEFTQIPFSGDENPRTRITKLTYQPNTDKLFVVDLRGKLYFLNGNKPEVYLDMASEKPAFIHTPGLATGFGSYAFHPEFAKNHRAQLAYIYNNSEWFEKTWKRYPVGKIF